MKNFIRSTITVMVAVVFSSCALVTSQSNTASVGDFSPTPQVPENTPIQSGVSGTAESYSNDQLGLCFYYPQGYTQIPYNGLVEIIAPDIPGSDVKGLFWFEMGDPNNHTAEEIADQEAAYLSGLNVGRWTVTLDGEQAVVLDGMPGQELQRRVYVVHQQTLYVLSFWPARSENQAAADQMETLFSAVTNSWAWSSCTASN